VQTVGLYRLSDLRCVLAYLFRHGTAGVAAKWPWPHHRLQVIPSAALSDAFDFTVDLCERCVCFLACDQLPC
jgi:hypothetical protein